VQGRPADGTREKLPGLVDGLTLLSGALAGLKLSAGGNGAQGQTGFSAAKCPIFMILACDERLVASRNVPFCGKRHPLGVGSGNGGLRRGKKEDPMKKSLRSLILFTALGLLAAPVFADGSGPTSGDPPPPTSSTNSSSSQSSGSSSTTTTLIVNLLEILGL
jgi:hypothetical protein